jgi:single-strand DNA-binding protein
MLNKVQLIGRLGKTPEIRQTKSDDNVANFGLATSTSWKDKNTQEWKENTQWHNIVCFGYNAEKAAKLSKGQLVYVEGALQTREWTNKEGVTVRTTEVVLQKFDGSIKSLEKIDKQNPEPSLNDFNKPSSNDFDDDIPF